MKKLILSIITFSILTQMALARSEYGTSTDEKDTLAWAFVKAQKFSGINSIDPNNWQKMKYYLLNEEELSSQVCPEDPQNCKGLAALFDTKTKNIYIREDLNPSKDMITISFLIHEMVHSLQFETKTEDELFGTCERLFATEKQAYSAQDDFLKSEGQFFRAGGALRFFLCQ